MKSKVFRVIGLMSGTSIDGIDAALIDTNGYDYVRPLGFMPHPYEVDFRHKLRACLGNKAGRADAQVAAFEQELTELHGVIVRQLIAKYPDLTQHIDLIGFHGQTIWHHPPSRTTIQLGDGAMLAKQTGIPVINDFRSADVAAGGNGAPLVPLYHRALAVGLPKPAAIINIGGVSNITWIGGTRDEDVVAFDVGPGNAMLDDWILRHTGKPFDEDGALAATGNPQHNVIDRILQLPFFAQQPPKSLDRDAFQKAVPEDLSPADGAATLTMLTSSAIARSLNFVPQKPQILYIAGGGRHNKTMMHWLQELSGIRVRNVDELGWSGDGLEAEAFAYLAVRSYLGLPLSMPMTTGVPLPLTGGQRHTP